MSFARSMLPALCLLLALPACQRPPARPSLLIVTLDTTRADRFGCLGYAAAHTPNFDRFAKRAVRFTNAISATPITFPSHTTILTGTYPVFNGVHDNDGYYLDPKVTTLAELLKGRGYHTAAMIGAFPLSSQFNLDQGFDSYDDNFTEDWTEAEREQRTPLAFGFVERKADRVNQAVARWLNRQAAQPFFLWVHYFDPHQPYNAPAPYDTQFADSPYDGEIAFMDEQFGKLLGLLESHQLLSRTVIAVVGDHGESLGQHGEPTHASYLYDATIRVPLMIQAPGWRMASGRKVTAQVRTLDLAPTLLELLGLPPGSEMQGRSLVPLLERPERPWPTEALTETYYSRFHYQWAPIRALRTADWKYIEAPKPELYDLRADPDEVQNRMQKQPARAAELAAQLQRLAQRSSSPDLGRSTAAEPDSEIQKKLRSLGYAAGGASHSIRAMAFPAPDQLARMVNPMDRALVLVYVNSAGELLRVLNFDECIPVARQGLLIDPGNTTLRLSLARALGAKGLDAEAREQIEAAKAEEPDVAEPWVVAGHLALARRDFQDALANFQRAVALAPRQSEVLSSLARAFMALGRNQEAIRHYEAVRQLDERDWNAALELGSVYALVGRLPAARRAFQQALDLNPYSPLVLYSIGLFYQQLGNAEFSRRMFEGVLRVSPNHLGAHLQLGELLLESPGQKSAAQQHLNKVIELAPKSALAQKARELLGEPLSS